MKTFTVKFNFRLEAETQDQAFDLILEYLNEIVQHEDLTPFLIQEEQQQ